MYRVDILSPQNLDMFNFQIYFSSCVWKDKCCTIQIHSFNQVRFLICASDVSDTCEEVPYM